MSAVLQIKNLSVSYKTKKILNSISLDINKGEILVIVGESGSGKSTLLRTLNGSISSDLTINENSSIKYLGNEILKVKKRNNKIFGTVYQNVSSVFDPRCTIKRQFEEMILSNNKCDKNKCYLLEKSLLQYMNVKNVNQVLNSYPFQLSGGQKQRVYLSMVMSRNPAVLLADEPTSALDVLTQNQIIDLLKKLNMEQGMTIVLVTHNIALACYIADKIAVMKDGVIVDLNRTEELLKNQQSEYTKKLFHIASAMEK